MALSSDLDSDYEGSGMDWKSELQSHRLEITKRMEYRRISPWLKNDGIFDQEDDQEVTNQTLNPTEETRMNHVVDKMMRKGEENYLKFLNILMHTYSDIYTSITKKEVPDTVKSSPIASPNPTLPFTTDTKEQILTILIERLEAKKLECEHLGRQLVMTQRDVDDRRREGLKLESQITELKERAERYESIERDMIALKDVMDRVKNENYKVCMRLVDMNEENSRLRERNMAMRIEIDTKDTDLKKMKSTVDSERRQSLRYRTRIQNGPSPLVIASLNRQIDELKLQVVQSKRVPFAVDDSDTRMQILQTDKEEALQMCAEASEKLNKLREEFNTAETLRDKYLEENENLRLQVSALTDDCDMFKTRRDAVWRQLQEVEKERDQLMKERNEAQMTAQNHMDEKTKYRSEIGHLEEKLDERSFQLREKEAKIRELNTKLNKQLPSLPNNEKEISTKSEDGASTTPEHSSSTEDGRWQCSRHRAFNIKQYSEFIVKSAFDVTMDVNSRGIGEEGEFPEIPLAKNYGNGCGNIEHPRPRKPAVRKKPRPPSSTTQQRNGEARSRSSSSDSEQLRKEDPNTVMVEIEAKALRECVRFTGGNKSGIFVSQIVDSQSSNYTPGLLRPGLRLVKIREALKKPHHVSKWSLEYAYDFIRGLEGTLVLILEPKQLEFQELKDKAKSSMMMGDSFCVRANFKWAQDGMLNFVKFEILHIVSTKPTTEMHWVACKVDSYTGNIASKCAVIPSLKYCMNHPHQVGIVSKTRALSEPSIFAPLKLKERQNHPSSVKLSPAKQSLTPLVLVRPNFASPGRDRTPAPYTIMQPVEIAKDRPRPCLFLPQSLSHVLGCRLTTLAKPLLFDFPYPESTNCAVSAARYRLYDRDIVSFKSVTEETQEVVTTAAVKKTSQMGKHCILSINENCISVKEYLRKLHEEEIYPIVVLLQIENKKTVKNFIEEAKSKASVVIQDMLLVGEQLKTFGCSFVTINLDRCNKVDDAIQIVMEKVTNETNRVVWKEDDGGILI